MGYSKDCCCLIKYMGSAYFYAQKGGANMSCCGRPGGTVSRPVPTIGRPSGPSPYGPRR